MNRISLLSKLIAHKREYKKTEPTNNFFSKNKIIKLGFDA